jgi:hypothetical protein
MDLQQQINELRQEIKNLNASTTIPFDVAESMKIRVLEDINTLATSGKDATSENETVTITGTPQSFTKLKQPSGFLQVVINNNAYFIPFYS